ncbi:MAG: hypothetical protein MPK62_15080, partial [Alphaproteobacteria bacterium]|nr:hypothetical protein [Alphaproteobacteria bacterium]
MKKPHEQVVAAYRFFVFNFLADVQLDGQRQFPEICSAGLQFRNRGCFFLKNDFREREGFIEVSADGAVVSVEREQPLDFFYDCLLYTS